jgi:hypothetical protein
MSDLSKSLVIHFRCSSADKPMSLEILCMGLERKSFVRVKEKIPLESKKVPTRGQQILTKR